jgi:hypothetical protein
VGHPGGNLTAVIDYHLSLNSRLTPCRLLPILFCAYAQNEMTGYASTEKTPLLPLL